MQVAFHSVISPIYVEITVIKMTLYLMLDALRTPSVLNRTTSLLGLVTHELELVQN